MHRLEKKWTATRAIFALGKKVIRKKGQQNTGPSSQVRLFRNHSQTRNNRYQRYNLNNKDQQGAHTTPVLVTAQ